MSELLDKQVNAQKESMGFTQAPASPQKVCDENASRRNRKNDGCLKYFCWEEGVYKAHAEISVMHIK